MVEVSGQTEQAKGDAQPHTLLVLASEIKGEAAKSRPTAPLAAPVVGRARGRSGNLFLCGGSLHLPYFALL